MTVDFDLAVARREPVGAIRFGEPLIVEPELWTFGSAIRYPIGWFDYDQLDGDFGGSVGGEEPGDEGGLPNPSNILRALAAVLQAPLCSLTGIDNVLEWPSALLPFQRRGVAALLERSELLLADEMGLGKTIQTIAAMRILSHRKELASALVVCPSSMLVQWRRELSRWAPELSVLAIYGAAHERGRLWRLPAHIKLIGYETLRSDVLDQHDSPAMKQKWGLVVLDEASRIKNAASGISVACKRLVSTRRWALTGTPIENSSDDATSILDFLVNPASSSGPVSQVSSPDLAARFRSHVLRRRRADVLPELPPKRIHEIALELGPAQRAAYDRAEQEGIMRLDRAGDTVTIVHVLELISRLKQICNCDPETGDSCKIDDVKQRLRTLTTAGHRALIFTQFTDETFGVGRLAKALTEFDPLSYTGQMSQQRRSAVIDTFIHSDRHKALILSLRAGGQGLNLQAASCVFHIDRWWNPAVEEQADSRSHRLGQTRPVTIYRYLCVNTIEERIDAKLRRKREIFQEFVDDARLDIATSLTESEIFGLFGLSGRRSRPV